MPTSSPDVLCAPGDIWEAGYRIGKSANTGDHVPHPGNYSDPGMFWHAMRAGLRSRGLALSLFLVVIPDSTQGEQ